MHFCKFKGWFFGKKFVKKYNVEIIANSLYNVMGDEMSYFANMTTVNIAGLVLLAAGAVINFAYAKIAGLIRSDYKHTPVIIKSVGLALVIAGFFMIVF
jgi:hypothetical protein